jgi:hypothetical protein
MRDASGLMYKRNRYYNPQTGQFTQPDPIGLVGGLNIYGFAAGDPVSYTDPYGLFADTTFTGAANGAIARQLWNNLRSDALTAIASGDPNRAEGGQGVIALMNEAETSPVEIELFVGELGEGFRTMFQGYEDCNAEGTRCLIELDHTQVTDIGISVRLAHELSGALQSLRGIDHRSPDGAVRGENAARQMYGCRINPGHNVAPTTCP